jgi:hypothetical protein
VLRGAVIRLQAAEREAGCRVDGLGQRNRLPGDATPQRCMPTSISTRACSVTPASTGRLRRCGHLRVRIEAKPDGGFAREAASRRSFPAPTIWLLTSTSRTPPRTSASASPTFWQHWPTAPAAICSNATSGALVRLGVGPQANARRTRERRHVTEVVLERIEVDDQGGRVDVVDRRADRNVHVLHRGDPFACQRAVS